MNMNGLVKTISISLIIFFNINLVIQNKKIPSVTGLIKV